MKIEEEIRIRPISSNSIWQGRRFKTKEYNYFIEEALYKMSEKEMLKGERLGVFLDFYYKYAARSDLDNFLKPTIDLLVRKKWIKDDRFIYFLQAQKFIIKDEEESKIIIKIIEL